MKRWIGLLVLLGCLWASAALAQMAPKPGDVFQDCPLCPKMVVVPAGSFSMGEQWHSRETPVHVVTFTKPFAIGVTTVTFDEWDACAADGGCAGLRPDDFGWGRGRRPVVGVSWNDAQRYTAWLSHKTGKSYRLPSEAEWEYTARAGTRTFFWWGDTIQKNAANCDGCGSPFDNRQTAPVASFKPNPFGLFDTAGNVTQWVADPWHSDYDGAPTDGSVWQDGDPRRMTMRSGSWFNKPDLSHAGYRNADRPALSNAKIGFRVAVSP
jgi:formylglycine-generating enzyme required for sulfatase activity